MKNSLELEIQLKIKRANRFLVARQYKQAVHQYTQGLDLYQENRRYNDCVSEQFKALLLSLRANAHSLNFDPEAAEEDFEKSLNINPYSPVTLSRRAKHFMKQKRFSQAIQDIDMALLYDPQNLNYLSLLNSIQNYTNDMKDQQEKKHIQSLINDVKTRLQAKPPTQSQSQEEDDQEMLNFSKLKKIDRQSVKLSPKVLEKRKSAIEFKQDQILEYEPEDQKQQEVQEEPQTVPSFGQIGEKLKEQEQQLKELEEQEEEIRKSQVRLSNPVLLTKTHEKSRKSILRCSSFGNQEPPQIFISSPGQKSSFSRRSSISAASIKDIDGKLITHQNQTIKFRPSISQLSMSQLGKIQQIPTHDGKENLSLTTPKLNKRKSCLRMSKRFSVDDIEQLSKTAPVKRKSSNFLNIKNIDGQYHKKDTSEDEINTPINIRTETQSDSDNQHNIFGQKKEKQVINLCDNIEELPDLVNKKLSKKKSILKKDSFIDGTLLSSNTSWKNQKKKSVLFKS